MSLFAITAFATNAPSRTSMRKRNIIGSKPGGPPVPGAVVRLNAMGESMLIRKQS